MRNLIQSKLAICCLSVLLFTSCQPGNSGNDTPPPQAAEGAKPNSKIWRAMKSCSPNMAPLPAQCQDQALCDDGVCSDTIKKLHDIGIDSFNAMRNRYDNTTLHDGQPVSKTKLARLVTAAAQACGDYRIMLNDESEEADNSNVRCYLEITSDKQADKVKAYYSVALFKGVLEAYPNADSLLFYKGEHPDGCKDIIFTVMVGTEVAYYGDLSGLFP